MRHFVIPVIWGLMPGLVQAQATFDRIKMRGHIVVGYREDAAPFSYHDDSAMKALVDAAINETIVSGKAQERYDKWFLKPIALNKARRTLDIPMSAELKAAFSAKW